MDLERAFLRLRSRGSWRDARRKLATLESFAATEEDGGKDLVAAAASVVDPKLREHLLRHARDEERHAALFQAHAAALHASLALAPRGALEPHRAHDLSRGRRGHEVDAHGFFRAGLCDELGEVAYVAMLHAAEERAARLFAVHRDLVADDPALRATFEEILVDEKYHVAYTQRFLEQWSRAGREHEVRRGLSAARASRFLGAWRRLGVRSAGSFAHVLLFALYWTVLLPFGLVSRALKPAPAMREIRPEDPARSLSGQA